MTMVNLKNVVLTNLWLTNDNNRALDKFSERQDNMSFHVQKWPDTNGWLQRRQRKRKEKKGEGKK